MDTKTIQQRLTDAGWYKHSIDGDFGRRTYAALLGAVAKRDLGDLGLSIGEGCKAHLPTAKISAGLRLAHFLTQTAVETGGFRGLEENLNYSAAGLMRVWPSRFPSVAATEGFVMNPKALAIRVYGGRLGNASGPSADGWTFRGRGLIQLTGRDNYTKRAEETGLPLLTKPEIAADPKISVQIAALYWTARKINLFADADDLEAVRKAVNGGQHGLADARTYFARAKRVLL
jgi:putative chitinase